MGVDLRIQLSLADELRHLGPEVGMGRDRVGGHPVPDLIRSDGI